VRGYALGLAISSAITFAHPVSAQPRTFGGYPCKQECDLHAVGYEWAKVRGVEDKSLCIYGSSRSFVEGCIAYIQNPARNADEDDEGNPVGVSVVPPGDR
jgi:hypothetical protein